MEDVGITTIKKLMCISFVLSGLTLTVLVYVTTVQKTNIKPRARFSMVKKPMSEVGAKIAVAPKSVTTNDSSLSTGRRNYGSFQEPLITNGTRHITSLSDGDTSICHMTIVVRGYILHFRDLQPKNRVTWCSNHSCNVSLIYTSNLTDILNANVTFFSHLSRLPPARDLLYLVEHRRPDQRYVLMSYETPLRVARNTTLPFKFARSFHHWQATYDPSSEIPMTYGRFRPLRINQSEPKSQRNYFKLKSKMVAFVSSNCIHAKWRRLDFVLELQKYIPIDIYGLCGNLTCDVLGNCTTILKQYKFILALENSPCRGYISEKFWNAIWKFQSVAIAWGANPKDYENFTPPQSYIYVENFRSIESLAGFIKNIGENETAYNSYHRWRAKYRVEMPDDLVKQPNNEQLCQTVDRYLAERPNGNNGNKIRFKDTNGRDWIKTCRIPVHTQMERFPIPVT